MQTADNDNIDGLMSFTFQAWYKTDGASTLSNGAQIFSANGNDNFLVNTEGAGPRLTVDGVGPINLGGTNPAGSWKFIAITYNGTQASNNVNYYQGDTTTGVSHVTTATLDAGQIASDAVGFAIGNAWNSFQRPFDGLLDNVRVFGSKTDATGVLTREELEAYRVADTTNSPVPEPTALGLLGAAAMGALRRRRT